MFSRLEEEGILNPDNDVDVYCLHEVFTSRINKCLLEFVNSWHNHPLSSEHNRTLFQLFCARARYEETNDEANDSPRPTVIDHIQIPNLHYIPCRSIKSRVEGVIHDNQQNDGCSVYRQISTIVGQHITSRCSH